MQHFEVLSGMGLQGLEGTPKRLSPFTFAFSAPGPEGHEGRRGGLGGCLYRPLRSLGSAVVCHTSQPGARGQHSPKTHIPLHRGQTAAGDGRVPVPPMRPAELGLRRRGKDGGWSGSCWPGLPSQGCGDVGCSPHTEPPTLSSPQETNAGSPAPLIGPTRNSHL